MFFGLKVEDDMATARAAAAKLKRDEQTAAQAVLDHYLGGGAGASQFRDPAKAMSF